LCVRQAYGFGAAIVEYAGREIAEKPENPCPA